MLRGHIIHLYWPYIELSLSMWKHLLWCMIQCDTEAKRPPYRWPAGTRCCRNSKCLMNGFMDLTFVFLCICILPGWKMISGIPAWNAAQTLQVVSLPRRSTSSPSFKIQHTRLTNKTLIALGELFKVGFFFFFFFNIFYLTNGLQHVFKKSGSDITQPPCHFSTCVLN